MKRLPSLLRCAFVATALVFSSALLSAADPSELGEAAGTLSVPAGFSASDVQAVIVRAFTQRKWTIQSQSDDRVVGHIRHDSNEATVTMVFTPSKIDLYCVGWQIDKKTGTHEKPEQPKRWLNYLKSDIPRFFGEKAVKK